MSSSRSGCSGSGPGYSSPMAAFRSGVREKLLYTTCIVPNKDRPDYLATIDCDPESETFSKVISRCPCMSLGDEIHHTGWNACSSCHDDVSRARNYLIMPGLISDKIYIVDVASDPRKPKLHKVVDSNAVHKLGVSALHTVHCLANGDVMISTMGDGPEGNAKGDFLLLDGSTFEVKGTFIEDGEALKWGYDFWYQPYHNVMISTEYGAPNKFLKGLSMEDVAAGFYGSSLHVFDWKERKEVQTIDLGKEGLLPLEIRFLHDPKADVGFVGCALSANVFRFYKTASGSWVADKVIDVPVKHVSNYPLSEMPGVITDILISMDDKFLYFSNWVHGDIRQYDITDTAKPKLVGQIFLGGSVVKGGAVKVLKDEELKDQPEVPLIQGRPVRGSPQMLQLSLDGKRLYATNSLLSPWDKQFYPDMFERGSMLLQIDVNTETGGLTLNQDFFIDFGDEPEGPVLAHETRYPGGDCSSDIYVAK